MIVMLFPFAIASSPVARASHKTENPVNVVVVPKQILLGSIWKTL